MKASSDDRDVSLLAVDQYMREIRQLSLMSSEEQETMLERIARARQEPQNQWRQMLAKDARARLVERYQPLVVRIARQCAARFHTNEWLDLAQEGNLGLLRALDLADLSTPALRRQFLSYAIKSVRGTIYNVWHARGHTVHLPYKLSMQIHCISQAKQRLVSLLGYEPTEQELSVETGMSVQQIRACQQAAEHRYVESLNALFEQDDRMEDQYSLMNAFAVAAAQETVRQQELQEAVQYALATVLTERQQCVMRLRLEQEYTQCEVAEQIGESEGNVYQIERAAKKRLEKALAYLYEDTFESLTA